jgi:hypothetical protein
MVSLLLRRLLKLQFYDIWGHALLAHHDQGLQSEEQGAQEANKHISQDGQIVLIIIADKTGLKYGPFFVLK